MADWLRSSAIGVVLLALLVLVLARWIPDLPRQRLRRSLLLFPVLPALILIHQFTPRIQ